MAPLDLQSAKRCAECRRVQERKHEMTYEYIQSLQLQASRLLFIFPWVLLVLLLVTFSLHYLFYQVPRTHSVYRTVSSK
jgi:hypothetical protein